MADKKFKLTPDQAKDLIWFELLQEDPENFTAEFRLKVYEAIDLIREAI